MSFEEYKKLPEAIDWEEWKQQFYYIIDVSQNEDYEEAINYISPFLRHKDIKIQRAAMQGLDMVASRFMNTNEKALFMLLDNLKSENKEILSQTFTTLESVAHFVLKFRREIYFKFFENGLDFYTNKKLKKYTNVKELASLNTIENKKEFVLSFCQHSDNYNKAFDVCLDFLQKDEHEELNIAVLQGFTYLIMRFEKIELNSIKPIFLKFLDAADGEIIGSRYGGELIYIQSLLVNIAYYIPALKSQATQMLRNMESTYIEKFKLKDNM